MSVTFQRFDLALIVALDESNRSASAQAEMPADWASRVPVDREIVAGAIRSAVSRALDPSEVRHA